MKQEEIVRKLELELSTLNSTAMGRRLFLLSAPFLLANCATPRHRHRAGDNRGQKTSITVKDEIKMAKEYKPQMLKDYPPFKNKYLQNYINHIGNNIVKKNGLSGKPYRYNFTLVNTPAVNAFALPAGEIFVTGALLTMAQSEAELAGVIGHEIGHVKARHSAERIDAAKQAESNSALFGIGGALLGGIAGYGLGKMVCKKKDKACMERIAKYGAAAGAVGGLLIQKYQFMANSREDEMEADIVGFKTSVNAGYDKNYVGKFYEKLYVMERKSRGDNNIVKSLADAMSTHPPSADRVKQMRMLAKKQKALRNSKITTPYFKKAQALVKKLMKA